VDYSLKGVDMKTYLFASLRGDDFEIQGESPEDAWRNLVEKEKDNGSLWKTSDVMRNKYAVRHEGFSKLEFPNKTWVSSWVAYKEL
jgi:hypothetical protein